jgi:peptidoglycan/xylan/chitin deacetylase (PgdA/CDA1 family)
VVGAQRILELLGEFEIESTWFIPGHTIETYPEICRRIYGAGHEIGHHGYLHEPPAGLTPEQEEAVLVRGNRCIKDLTGAPATGYRSPSWDLSPYTVELLVGHGFKYDSSMMAHDHRPYHARQGDVIRSDGPPAWGRPTSLVEMPVSWSLDDFPHFEYRRLENAIQPGLMNAGLVLENWVADFRYMTLTEEWGVLTYTFHPQVVGRGHRMLLLEGLIKQLTELGAQFARLDQALETIEW